MEERNKIKTENDYLQFEGDKEIRKVIKDGKEQFI